ncbi:LysM peptidoglycan-binding domain-containing protein [Microbacterium sp. GXF7504]
MSTIEYAPTAFAPRAATGTRLRITARGRRVLTFLAAAPLVAVVCAGVFAGGSALASREGSAPVGTFETVTVGAGESLWSIAEEVAPAHDPRDVVAAIQRLNALEGAQLHAGQRLSIPLEYAQG